MSSTAELIGIFGLEIERRLEEHEARLLGRVTAHIDTALGTNQSNITGTVQMQLNAASETIQTNVAGAVQGQLNALSQSMTDSISSAVKTLQTSILSLMKPPNDPAKAVDLMRLLEEAALLGETAEKAREAAKSAQTPKLKREYEELAEKASSLQADALKQAMDIVGLP